MEKKDFAFGKNNYIICILSVLIIIAGFAMMTGSASTIEHGFQEDIFSTRRIVIAPMMCFFGFLLMIVGILFPSSSENKENKESY